VWVPQVGRRTCSPNPSACFDWAMTNDPQDNVDVNADGELSDEALSEVSGGNGGKGGAGGTGGTGGNGGAGGTGGTGGS
jgi:hypothetical protein